MNNRLLLRRMQSTVNPFLDATIAFSLLDLGLGATNVIRVRRTGGATPTERDFTATEIVDGTLTAWVGAGNDGFISIWYNLNGSNHARQTNASNQHQIVFSGSLQSLNGNVIVDSNNSPGYYLDNTVNIKSIYHVGKIDSFSLVNYVAGNDSPTNGFFLGGNAGGVEGLGVFDGTTVLSNTDQDLNFNLNYIEIDGDVFVQKNNVSEVNLGAFTSSNLDINIVFGREGVLRLNSRYSIFLGYENSTRSIKDDIRAELNTLYNVY